MARKLIVSDFAQDVLPAISDEDAGWLFRALVALNSGQDPPGTIPASLSVAWLGIRKQQQALVDAYERTCEARRKAGRAGGFAKSSKCKQMLANAKNGDRILANASKCDKEKEKEKGKADEPLPSKRVNKPMTDDPMTHAPASAPASENAEPAQPPVSSAIGSSDHRSSVFINPSSFEDPVDYALAVTGEPGTIYARRCYGMYLRDLGQREFIDCVATFAAEVRAGEVPRSIPAALNARLSAARNILQSLSAGCPAS